MTTTDFTQPLTVRFYVYETALSGRGVEVYVLPFDVLKDAEVEARRRREADRARREIAFQPPALRVPNNFYVVGETENGQRFPYPTNPAH